VTLINSIRIAQDFSTDIDRDDMHHYPSLDDPVVTVYRFADGHDPNQIYVVEDETEGPPTELDLAILYSPTKLSHAKFPRPGKSPPSPMPVSLIAYQGDETAKITKEYPHTDPQELNRALDELQTDRLSIVSGITGTRNEPGRIYHRCSSATGASGGVLVNNQGQMIGTLPPPPLVVEKSF
jgi:hypothetical protein